MKNLKLLYYVLKWLALAFLSYLLLFDTRTKTIIFILIGFVAAVLIWQGIRDFKPRDKGSAE
jgi:O-antigen ligase